MIYLSSRVDGVVVIPMCETSAQEMAAATCTFSTDTLII